MITQEEREALIEQHGLSGSDNPAVYCGTYSKYNKGSLEGWWLDLTTFYDYDDFIEVCTDLHSDEDDPELMFQDYENFPEAWYSESLSEDVFNRIIDYADLDDDQKDAFEEYIREVDSDGDVSDFKNRYIGQYDSGADFAKRYVGETQFELLNGAGWLADYLNYENIWYCSLRHDYTLTNSGYLFRD